MGKAFDFQWNDSSSVIFQRKGFTPELNKKLAEVCREYMEPYVPYLEGGLSSRTQIRKAADGGYQVVYLSKYAYFQYNGITPQGGTIDESKRCKAFHPKATSFWDQSAFTGHKREIVAEVDKYRKSISQ